MTEVDRGIRNQRRLAECDPVFRARLAAILEELEAAGLRPRIQVAYRSPADQAAAVRSGKSKLDWGYHQAQEPDGSPGSLAADVIDDAAPLAPGGPYLLRLAAAARANGCETGIGWYSSRTVPDPAVRAALRARIDVAIAARDWSAPVRVGWDPAHVQVADITIAQAKSGMRPK